MTRPNTKEKKGEGVTMTIRNTDESTDKKVIISNKPNAKLKGKYLEIPH